MQQRQERAMLSCDIDTTPPPRDRSGLTMLLEGARPVDSVCEAVESLQEAVSADIETFCSRHPGYAHWLFDAAFELEWSNHQTAVPMPTWDV